MTAQNLIMVHMHIRIYGDCEMKKVVDMQHNPFYAVPSQLTESKARGNVNKMADKEGAILLNHLKLANIWHNI